MFKFFGKLPVAVLAITGLATAVMAASHIDKAHEGAVNARQAQMQLIGYHTGILGAMAKGETEYNAEEAKAAASNLHAAAMLNTSTMWIEGTEQGTAKDTRAKAEIWTDAAGFAEKFAALEKASAAMIDAAGTDVDSLKAGMGAIGGACKACHETYRGPEN